MGNKIDTHVRFLHYTIIDVFFQWKMINQERFLKAFLRLLYMAVALCYSYLCNVYSHT